MTYKIKLEQFEGPLDLLLRLIEQEELDITTVSLAKVTDQYLEYLNNSTDITTDELADFLVVAAKLLLIKSRLLLPKLVTDEEEGIDLEYQLKMYKEFYEASKVLQKMLNNKKFLFPREKMVIKVDKVFNPPKSINTDTLRKLFVGVLQGLEAWVSLEHEVIARTVSIRERIANIQQLIKQQADIKFKDLLKTSKNRVEVIVTFLALLELVKQRSIAVVQGSTFDEIIVKRTDAESLDILESN